MIYLLGVNHGMLFENIKSDKNAIRAFERYLKEVCSEYDIDCIAEEMNVEFLEKWRADRDVCESIAAELKLMHIYCDPDSSRRQKRGIKLEREIRDELGYEIRGQKFGVRSWILNFPFSVRTAALKRSTMPTRAPDFSLDP
jgi:hypothetical protein